MINWENILIWALIVVAVLLFMWAEGKIHNILLLLVDISNNNKLQKIIENEYENGHEIEAPVKKVALAVQLVYTLAMIAPVLYIFWLIIK